MADAKKLIGGLGKLRQRLMATDDEASFSAIQAAGRAAHEQEASIRAAKNAQVKKQMANLPARSKKANQDLGLYHPVGGGLKLSKPTRGMHSTTVADPKFNPPEIGNITPEQLVKEEAALFPLVGDRAAAGRYLTHVDENELEIPVRLTGGPRYMDANYNPISPDDSAAWESGLGRVTALGRQAERAGEGGRPVYGIYTAGSGTNTDFNIMGANALYQQIAQSKITKKAEREFDQAMRVGTKEFPPIPNWPGIRSPEAYDLLLDKSNGIARTKLFGTMGKENFQSMGFPDVPATRKAIIEPELLDVPTNQAGFRMARMDTKGRIIEDPIIPSDYPIAMAGKVAGRLDVPADYKDVFQSHFDARRLLSQPESGDYYSFSRAHPIQYADDEWLNRLMEKRRADELRIKEGEYKKGGKVEDASELTSYFDNRIAGMAKGGKVGGDDELTAYFDKRMGMAQGGGAFKKLKFMADGGKLVKGATKVMKKLFADDAPKATPYAVTAPAVPRKVSAGDIVNGMLVRKDIPNTSSIGASLTDYSTHGLQEVPMSAFETVGKPRYRSAQERERTQELSRQIQQNKELNPLIVVKDAEGHYILEGGHRFDALRELGIDSFPALMVHDLESLADVVAPVVNKAEGGLLHMADAGRVVKGARKIYDKLFNDDVLPVAEREANLQKFLAESKIPQRLYHGTGNDIREFKNSRIGALGPGTYLAESPKNASDYASINRRDGANQPNVMPVYAQAKNPFVISDVNKSHEELFKRFDPEGKLTDDEVIRKVLNAGYDSIYAKSTGEINMLDPRKIKSAIGNRGTYDVKDADINKAEGGPAFKKLQFMNKGGITTTGGSFSPEELGVSADEIGLSRDQLETVKKNAPAVFRKAGKMAKDQLTEEYNQLKTAGGAKDFALRTGASYLGGIPDLINLGLMIPDAVVGTNLSSDKPWFGSAQYLEMMKDAGMLGENEFPLAEVAAGLLSPASLIKKGKQIYKNSKLLKDAPKKRSGGLTAMAR